MADLGIASRTDMKNHADMIANLDPSKILIADMDTGYGGKYAQLPRPLVYPFLISASRPHHYHDDRKPVHTRQCCRLSH